MTLELNKDNSLDPRYNNLFDKNSNNNERAKRTNDLFKNMATKDDIKKIMDKLEIILAYHIKKIWFKALMICCCRLGRL